MDAPLFLKLSSTKVRRFLQCRKQYWWAHECSEPWPTEELSPPLIVGKAVHVGMENLCDSGDPEVGRQHVEMYLRMPECEAAGPGTEWHGRALRLYDAGVAVHGSLVSQDRWAEKQLET